MHRQIIGLTGMRLTWPARSAFLVPTKVLQQRLFITRLLSARLPSRTTAARPLFIRPFVALFTRHNLLTLPDHPNQDHLASGTRTPNTSSSGAPQSGSSDPSAASNNSKLSSNSNTNDTSTLNSTIDSTSTIQNTVINPKSTLNNTQNIKNTFINNSASPMTKNALLAQASTRILRLLVHIKWPLTRNNRPFSLDDFLAFASWVVMGHLLWFLLGTTTFVLASLYILSLAGQIGEYFGINSENHQAVHSSTSESVPSPRDDGLLSSVASAILSNGLNVVIEFEKGSVLPVLRDGMLRFKNVTIISKRDSRIRANAEHLNLSLSFGKWYEGNGVIDELEIFGMNGSIFQSLRHSCDSKVENDHQKASSSKTEEFSGSDGAENSTLSLRHNEMANFHQHNYEDEQAISVETNTPKSFSEKPFIDPDYILSNFKIRDSCVDIYSNPAQPPIRVLIFNCDISDLHGDRLLVDFFGSNNVTGAINDSMFTIHKHQRYSSENNRMVRFKLDGLDLGELAKRHASLKFNWIVQGKVEVVADILLPQDSPNETWEYLSFTKMFSDAFNSLFTEPSAKPDPRPQGEDGAVDKQLLKGALAAIYDTFSARDTTNGIQASEYVMVDLRLKLKNLQASLPQELPATSSGTPFISLHDLRKLIGFVNDYFEKESRPPLTIKTSAIEKMADLSNLGSITETTLFNVLVSEIYEDLRRMADVEDKRIIDEKSVWSHSIASHLLLLGLGVIA